MQSQNGYLGPDSECSHIMDNGYLGPDSECSHRMVTWDQTRNAANHRMVTSDQSLNAVTEWLPETKL
ncbi:hypothetical protein DPMN_090607 [Dreissena polymorpha]|uniref:Uncharacterized protein n=1 Tax=Dreissena polymorpha TaxID=45954 RepID=A0A9D4QZ60_DREPO|nr:hypothetical protein DPMN_090607 [Dreissena polymorpha]